MPNRYFLLFLSAFLFLAVSCRHSSDADDHDDDEHHEHTGISLEPDKAEAFGIEYEIVTPGSFHHVIKTSGSIEPSSSDITTVTAKKSGIITLNQGINIGSEVKTGERLGYISSEGVQGGDAAMAAAANLEAAKAEYQRLKPLYEEGLVTASTFREAERAYNEAKALSSGANKGGSVAVTASGSGNIQSLLVRSGDYVEVGTPIAVVGKNTNLLLRADLPARESLHLAELETANFIPEGREEIVKLSDVNGKRVSSAGLATASNGYIPVFFSFSGNALSFPGGYAEVFLICGEGRGVISVPRDALVEIQGNKFVYIAEDDHDYDKILVKTGASDGERVEILEGLSEGDKIVSKGASIIRMAEISSVAPPAHTHNH